MERYTEMSPDKAEGVQSVARALRLLRSLSQHDDGLRVSDLSRLTGLAVSTTHRLLTTLELQGFAQFDPDSALWHVGREAFAVGASFGRRQNFVAPALPFLRRLRDATRETANLGILDNDELVTVSQVESREIMRAISPPGGRVPAFCSGMGKAILATWEDADIAAFVARTGLHPMTARSHRDVDSAMRDIARIRRQGYALDDEEHVTGLRCIAAVVWSAQGEAACAISISGLAARLPDDKIDRIGQIVARAARDLTETLGGHPPPSP